MSVFAAYGGVFAFIVSVIAVGYQPPQPTSASSAVVTTATQSPSSTPDVSDNVSVDELVAIDLGARVAKETDMFIANNVANLAVSLELKAELAQTSDIGIVKQQIVQPTASSSEVVTYVVKEGDTVDSIATAHAVKTETIKWANNLVGSAVAVGRTLTIPPIDGVLYTVRSGDTVESIATAYSASKDRITSVNNLELGGLKPGMKVLVPNGNLPENQRPGYVAPYSSSSSSSLFNSRAVYGGNGYAYGYCTYYAAARRAELGKPIPSNWGNASSWADYARAQGFTVSRVPRVGAIMQNSGGYGGFGHVAIVEEVHPDGTITISEMNGYRFGGGWNRIGHGKISSSGYWYIY